MLTLHDGLLLATMLLLVLLLVLLNQRQHVDWALADENNLTIFDAACVLFTGDNATLSNVHGIKIVVTADRDLALPLSLERDECVVIEAGRELHVIGITAMGQFRCRVERLVPVVLLYF